jgi:hypothetical protein
VEYYLTWRGSSIARAWDIYYMKEYKCKYCSKITKPLGLAGHERLCPNNPNRKKEDHPSYGRKGTNQYIKAKENGEEYVPSQKEIEARKIRSKKRNDIRWSKPGASKKHSNAIKEAIKRNPDAYSKCNVSGRAMIYEYNGFKLKGTWELEVAKWLDRQGIKWTNDIEPFEYEWEDSIHLYFPDFYLEDYDRYIEVKGYQRERDLAKWSVVKDLIVIKQKLIKQIIANQVFLNDLL